MLRKPVDLLPADQVGALHFIAIGGAGMSALAEIYNEMGIPVSGCDLFDSAALRQLHESGITTYVGHSDSHLDNVDTVVVSSAIPETNPELIAARSAGLRIWHRSAALGALMISRRGISVTGTHGKTTTSAMTATMLTAMGVDPSYVIGSPLANSGRSAHMGGGDMLIIEADESDGSFLQYPTEIAVITNIEADHLDNWGTAKTYHQGFWDFAHGDDVRSVVINADDRIARQLAEDLRAEGKIRVVSYGQAADADYRFEDIRFDGTFSAAQLHADGEVTEIQLQVPGSFNLGNATAAVAVGRVLGLELADLVAAVGQFAGTLRRFQLVASVAVGDQEIDPPVRIFDDYAHHPTEVRACLQAARTAAGPGRVIACFQPHLYSRTRDFAVAFGQALGLADVVVVTDVYGAREDPISGISGSLIADAVRDHRSADTEVHYVQNKTELPEFLAGLVRPGNLIMTLGAGDITVVGPLLAQQLRQRSTH